AAALLAAPLLCTSLGSGSAHEVVPSFLQTLLEGSAEQFNTGPLAQYQVDDLTRAALAVLKERIDELPPQHVKALLNLLVINS
ncbi:Secretoglobin family 1C member 1, partial [Calypte anna]